MQDVKNHRGAPLYSGTPAPSSGLICANFFDCSDFYNRLNEKRTEISVCFKISISGELIQIADRRLCAEAAGVI